MFSNSDKKVKPDEIKTNGNETNRISSDTEVKGDLISNGNFRIDGKILGNIKTKGKVVIGKKGFVKGTIDCMESDIEGKVDGRITVQKVLSLKSSCNITSETLVGSLSVEPGAVFNGICKMHGSQPTNEKFQKKESSKK